MPELPEVDAIVGVARRHSVGNTLSSVEVVRQNGKYFEKDKLPRPGAKVSGVFRVGKYVSIDFEGDDPSIVAHNAMTGYFDWEHEPWTFDYVEGDRESIEDDVRVRFTFADGKVLRFHDTRLFGFMFLSDLGAPLHGPELLTTPHMSPKLRIITLEEFWKGMQVKTPVKVHLMDQDFVSGIGNIYSSESCHAAGVDPRVPSNSLSPDEVAVLHASILWTLGNCIPQVRYDWLKVYRQASCGTCGDGVTRIKLGGRSTFFCPKCQPR